jgi:sugar transferase EpsL
VNDGSREHPHLIGPAPSVSGCAAATSPEGRGDEEDTSSLVGYGALRQALLRRRTALIGSLRVPTIKRMVDLVGSAAALLLATPVMIGVALAVRARLGSPVLFSQERPGLHGRLFRIYKFRTMTAASSESGELLPDAERLTDTGRFLRRWSLDELPELWNILSGDMSLVGPRPLLAEYLELYSPEQMRRHEMPPGITGLAQVEGRNDTTWEERLALDVWYVDHWSLGLDLSILGRTIWRVLSGRGISAADHATMPRFEGGAGE